MSNSLLVTIEKGAQTLRIHVDALEQHIKLGWKKVEAAVEELVDEMDGGTPAPAKAKGAGAAAKDAAPAKAKGE